MIKRLTYLYSDTDRHGNQRLYFKPPGWSKKIRIRHAAGSREAKAEYKRLYAMYEAGDGPESKATVTKDSIEWLLRQYQASAAFAALAPNTRLQRSNFYTRFCRAHGHIPYDSLTVENIADTRDALPRFAGRNFVKSMRAAFKWACSTEVRLMRHNPAAAVSLPTGKTKGHAPWTLSDVAQYRDHYPKGHNARIALVLLLCTAQRVSDIRTMGRKDVRNGILSITHVKTGNPIDIPILGLLRDELGESYGNMVWLVTKDGAPYSDKSLSMRISKWAKDAGLEDRTAHGVRKSVGGILGELGLSENVIMAILGHSTSGEAQGYVKSANRLRMSKQGMEALEAEFSHFWAGGKVG